MKKISCFLLSLCLLISLKSMAQVQDSTIAIPNGSFEDWSNGSGYSVTVMFFPLQVYSSYTYPTGWDFPTYPVNQSITYSGINVNVNTNLPLLKVTDVNNGAVDSSHALGLQSFMLSDIISSTVYSLAQSSLDPMYVSMIFPTVLSTGVVDMDQLIPFMDDITNNFGNISQLMSIFDGVDVNDVITGGVALNGSVPGRLTGYYKYTSAVGGDNGGVLLIGTKYNQLTHRREVVGGGYAISLTDTSTFAPFEAVYSPLSDINPTSPYVEADSLVILLFSSANSSPQQGSILYLDNLQLWAQQEVIPEDTCSAIFNLSVQSVDTMHATLNWTYEGTPDHFEAEYGVQGFTLGNGNAVTLSTNSLSLSDLQPDSYYDVYVRCVCDTDLMGEWAMTTFHTDTLVPPVIIPDDTCSAIFNLSVQSVDTMHAVISWTYEGTPDHFEVEYGAQGFIQDNGTTVNVNTNGIALSDLQPDSYYDVYVRCVCDTDLMGEWAMTTFHTDTLVPPVIIPDDTTGIQMHTANQLLIYPNPANGQCVVQFSQELPKVVKLYSIDGVLLRKITAIEKTMELVLPSGGIFILSCEMREGTIVRKIVNR